VYKPQPPKFTASEKEKILAEIKTAIEELPKLSKKVSRINMRANRIYLYELYEQFIPEGAICQPGTDGKYIESPYARITLNDTSKDNCSVDWQRHNEQWMTLHTGTLTECLHAIESDDDWF
jgi:hypothetical protein